jgi:hypothetical protein
MADFEPLGEDELQVLIEQSIRDAAGYSDTKLSKERAEVLDYYHGVKPKPYNEGNSKYVSMDVNDSVESLKASLLETFSAGTDVARFIPSDPIHAAVMPLVTAKVETVIHRQNDGYEIYDSVIHNALMARTALAKVFWETKEEEVEETFEAPIDSVDLLIADDSVTLKEMEVVDEIAGIVTGTICRTVNKSQAKIAAVPPEELLIDTRATSLYDDTFKAHRTLMSISDLLKAGYDKDKVEKIASDTEDEDYLQTDPEILSRFYEIDDGVLTDGLEDAQRQTNRVFVYECYLHVDMEGTGMTKLHKIVYAGREILEIEVVDRLPFLYFTPLPIPHSFFGSNFAKKVIPIQNARTVLTRAILDHTVMTTNPRWMVVKGAVTNPKEMLDNRRGGVVNVTRPDGILPFPQAAMNPFVFQTIQMLDEDKEDTTGVSKLSQGLNKDAISKQNSAAMVEQLATLSMQRQKIIARNFANQFVKKLYLEVYRLLKEFDKSTSMVEINGKMVPVTPAMWPDDLDVEVALKLGYGEREAEIGKLMNFHAMMAQDPDNKSLYQLPQRRKVIGDILKLQDRKDVDSYLERLENIKPPQPDPMMIAQVEIEKMKAQAAMVNAQAAMQKVEMHAQIEQMKLEFAKMRETLSLLLKGRDLDRKDAETDSRISIAEREMDLAESAPETQTNTIVSPNA